MQKVVLDTDIIIDFTRKASTYLRDLLDLADQKQIRLFIAAVGVAELMSGKETLQTDKLRDLKLFVKRLEFVPLDCDLSEIAGFLIRDNKGLGLGDAIIAATAISLKAKLATRNNKDFQDIKGLKFFKMSTKRSLICF
ncbi:PIN domain-containing protein [Candidatus Daviesbacteria bacterium]|nr:PIN domain-containing protein [Candidatus Daviesbacteria bacterium]